MVIWLFAGGGEAELGDRENGIRGIVHFFEKHFPDFTFIRITPVRAKRPPHRVSINASVDALGKTGAAFAKQIKVKLEDAIEYRNPSCDAILILDDLDCCCIAERTMLFDSSVNQAGNGVFQNIIRIIGFAAPELEAWVIADWNNTMANHIDFRKDHQAMQDYLQANKVSFDAPEMFSFYDRNKNSCHDKLSELLIESSRQKSQITYSKAKHTPFLLHESLKPDVVARKCPIFRGFYAQLQNLK